MKHMKHKLSAVTLAIVAGLFLTQAGAANTNPLSTCQFPAKCSKNIHKDNIEFNLHDNLKVILKDVSNSSKSNTSSFEMKTSAKQFQLGKLDATGVMRSGLSGSNLSKFAKFEFLQNLFIGNIGLNANHIRIFNTNHKNIRQEKAVITNLSLLADTKLSSDKKHLNMRMTYKINKLHLKDKNIQINPAILDISLNKLDAKIAGLIMSETRQISSDKKSGKKITDARIRDYAKNIRDLVAKGFTFSINNLSIGLPHKQVLISNHHVKLGPAKAMFQVTVDPLEMPADTYNKQASTQPLPGVNFHERLTNAVKEEVFSLMPLVMQQVATGHVRAHGKLTIDKEMFKSLLYANGARDAHGKVTQQSRQQAADHMLAYLLNKKLISMQGQSIVIPVAFDKGQLRINGQVPPSHHEIMSIMNGDNNK